MQIVELASRPCDSLDWSKELSAVATGKKIFWKFTLGLEQPFFPLEDELYFQSLSLALTQFSKDVWPLFKEDTYGLCLYWGAADLPAVFSWTDKQKEAYAAWILEEELPDDADSKRLFCLEAFAVYFQMLSHRLPDEANVFLLFDLAGFTSPSAVFAALSKERFEHFMVGLKGMDLPREGFRWEEGAIYSHSIDSSTGLIFPTNRDAYAAFDLALSSIEDPVKVVFEHFLSEEWGGLDRILVPSEHLTPQGERMLKGFLATGGEVIRGRGIRTPDLLVPNQPR